MDDYPCRLYTEEADQVAGRRGSGPSLDGNLLVREKQRSRRPRRSILSLERGNPGETLVSTARIGSVRVAALIACVCPVALTDASHAIAIYEYEGNNFTIIEDSPLLEGSYTTEMSVSGSITLASPLPPSTVGEHVGLFSTVLAWSFTDGRGVLNESNSEWSVAGFSTDSTGNILEWDFFFDTGVQSEVGTSPQRHGIEIANLPGIHVTEGGGMEIYSCSPQNPTSCSVAGTDVGGVLDDSSTWNLVPEPSTALLLAAGLAGLATRRRIASA